MKQIDLIVGTRPNIMKVAPVYHALRHSGSFAVRLIHTGQHYSYALSELFFQELGLPAPDLNFNIGSGSHATQTAKAMVAYEDSITRNAPDLCIVPGDVNSTLACALAAAKQHVPVAHLEAGLRSFDMTMPEEINRILTDRIADILWTPSADADENLLAEGVAPEKITLVGNCMIDSLVAMLPRIEEQRTWTHFGLRPKEYAVVTLHRPGNVDSLPRLRHIMQELLALAGQTRLILPLHPRTHGNLVKFGFLHLLTSCKQISITPPVGYIEFLSLVMGSQAIITDSGGIQEEASYLGIPCLTVRPNTERPITCALGTNVLVSPETLAAEYRKAVDSPPASRRAIPNWDGEAGRRIAKDIAERFSK